MGELQISWDQYHQKIEDLAVCIGRADWSFTHIICLAKGGLRVGDILARIFDKPLGILVASSYGDADGKTRGQIKFADHLSSLAAPVGPILLVDDLADSGVSLQAAYTWLHDHYPTITELRTATIWVKGHSIVKPDFFVEFLPDNPWICQPFERYENLSIENLLCDRP
ncbi:MAG: phosphoribosyltransferase domain-containing protein [Cyanobacteria bacterium P01_H01_bin.15]